MKKRFLPISLLLTIIILAQTSFVVSANGDSGKYNPRSTSQATAQSFMKSIRANQETGLIDPAWMLKATKDSQTREGELNWTSLGPDNYGSMTRGIIYDNQDPTNKTIYIGTMGGGVFKSENGGITWRTVTDNLMVSCMAQTKDGTIYIGTGDGRGAHNQNGLSDLNYENSFNGTGIYSLKGNTLSQIENTSTFVNDLAVYNNKVYAATNEGIKCYDNGNWTVLIEGEAYGIEVCSDNDIFAVVGDDIYMTDEESESGYTIITNDEENMLPSGNEYKIIAAAPSDCNYIYAAYIKSDGATGNIYVTKDHGKTWNTAYIASNMYNIFGGRGLLDNAIMVYPNNPNKLLIGGLDLWVVKDDSGEGIYRLERISSGASFQIQQAGGLFFYNYTYIHYGIQSIAFNPNNVNEFFVGSEGGIFKGNYNGNTGYTFEGANRYMIDAENHTSVTRMFSVGFAGDLNKTIGGCLDHGTISVVGDPNTNNVTTGSAIYPNDIATTNAAETYFSFDFAKAGGPCAISTINPQVMFVTATGDNSPGTPLLRTETAGYDYDKDNFSYSVTDESTYIANADAFRTPIALFENYNDTKSTTLAKFVNKGDTIPAGETITIKSNSQNYPFEYTLTEALPTGDSIELQDIISSTLFVAVKGKVYMTRDALAFDKKTTWWQIGTISGIPNALTISADGDIAYIGTIAGKLYKATGLSDIVDTTAYETALNDTILREIADASTVFNGQAITSVSINPNDNNEVIVTLGNYGNSNYVFHATDGQTFTAVQGNLPAMPVYSSMIEKQTGKVFVGTENGIWTSDDMVTWTQDASIKNIPVMDIKQQTQANHENKYEYLVDEVGDVTTIEYPGIFNEGMIYIATYGRGLYKCDNYLVELPEQNGNENEDEEGKQEVVNLRVYPNPIVNEAYIDFEVEDNTQVSIDVYDLSGRKVMSNLIGNFQEGSHQASFSVEGLRSGTYIVKVQVGSNSTTTKVMVY